ncbi:MAG: zinc-binding dehydrogenase [Dehalococcoidia bacterium]|nr:zinc-binding dehydrogenase [Dehalococcoidia bacterium]MDW8120585.1 zinc-binding dehydrogenase [Chloroflexota bacterium]
MKAIQVIAPQRMRLVDVPIPAPGPGQVLVRMEALSICGTDMRRYRHPQPAYPLEAGVPCHECAGTIVESRADGWKEGQRVILLPALNMNGGAEYVVGSPSMLIALPPEGDAGEWLMCQPWGTVLYALERVGSVLGKQVVVVGQGAIGLLFTMSLLRMGADFVAVVDPLEERLALARRLGAHLTLNPHRQDAVKALLEATQGRGGDLVVEASGEPEAIDTALQVARVYGTVVLFGIPEEDRVHLHYFEVLRKQLTLLATVSATSEDPTRFIKLAVELRRRGFADPAWIITHRMGLEDAPRAYDLYARRAEGVVKVVLKV